MHLSNAYLFMQLHRILTLLITQTIFHNVYLYILRIKLKVKLCDQNYSIYRHLKRNIFIFFSFNENIDFCKSNLLELYFDYKILSSLRRNISE